MTVAGQINPRISPISSGGDKYMSKLVKAIIFEFIPLLFFMMELFLLGKEKVWEDIKLAFFCSIERASIKFFNYRRREVCFLFFQSPLNELSISIIPVIRNEYRSIKNKLFR